MTKWGRNALYSLRGDKSIIIKEAGKGAGVVVWERGGYLAEPKKQLDERKFIKNVEKMLKGHFKKLLNKW